MCTLLFMTTKILDFNIIFYLHSKDMDYSLCASNVSKCRRLNQLSEEVYTTSITLS